MSVQHIKALLFRSAQLQQEIEKEQKHRWPDTLRLLKLKKLRLVLKDRIERLVKENVHFVRGRRRPSLKTARA